MRKLQENSRHTNFVKFFTIFTLYLSRKINKKHGVHANMLCAYHQTSIFIFFTVQNCVVIFVLYSFHIRLKGKTNAYRLVGRHVSCKYIWKYLFISLLSKHKKTCHVFTSADSNINSKPQVNFFPLRVMENKHLTFKRSAELPHCMKALPKG